MIRSEAILAVLKKYAPTDLAARYSDGVEVHVSVVQGDGTPCLDANGKPKSNCFTDRSETWFPVRIPKYVGSEPVDNGNQPQLFDLEKHYDSIGVSGWDFKQKVSRFVVFDIDSLETHAAGVGISQERMNKLLEFIKTLDYVEIRKSTSGSGYHLWVLFDEKNLPQIESRQEHAALARAVLQKMSADCGCDFSADVDCCGRIVWVCAKRATPENGGLTLVQAAKRPLTDYPPDWRDQLSVITHKRNRTRIKGVKTDAEADRIDLENQNRPRVPLDTTHHAFMEAYSKTEFAGYWHSDLYCFVGHVCGVLRVFGELHLKGVFKTLSQGTDPGTPNCFMFPLPNGGWRIFRFGTPNEAPTWELSSGGWRTCVINAIPSFAQIEKAYNGRLSPNGSGIVFLNFTDAVSAVAAYGGKLELPRWLTELSKPRPITLKLRKEGGLQAEFEFKNGVDDQDGRDNEANEVGWLKVRGPLWASVIDVETDAQQTAYESIADNLVRQVSRNGEQYGLFVHTSDGRWDKQSVDRIKDNLTHRGIVGSQQSDLLGFISNNPYYFVAKPFQGEHPQCREWNLGGAQLLYQPAIADGPTHHWDLILNNVGRGLDDAVETEPWCDEHGIKTGADYLRLWIANVIRFPLRRLPMLAMYSEQQNTGKSSLQEGIALLFDEKGFSHAETALTNSSGFNGELYGRALCAAEEIDLASSKFSYDRIKSWVTSPTLQITYKGQTPFDALNFTHWIYSTQHKEWIAIEPGDTRMIVWEVTMYEGADIPKATLLERLQKEAPFFMRQLYQLDLSDIFGRHTLPTLLTKEKLSIMDRAASKQNFPGLEGDALKAADAIGKMSKPWGPGSAMDFCKAIGDWDGQIGKKTLKSRANTLGRYLRTLQAHLAKNGVNLEIRGGKNKYAISEIATEPASVATTAS